MKKHLLAVLISRQSICVWTTMSCCLSQNVLKYTHTCGNRKKSQVVNHILYFWSQTASWDSCKAREVETAVTAAHTGGSSGWSPRVQITNCVCPLSTVQHNTPGHSKIPKRKGWGETPKLSLLKLYLPLREHPGGDLTLNYLLPITTLCMRSRASLSRTAGIFMGCRFCQSSLEMVFLFIVTEGDSSAVDWAPQTTSDACCRLNCPSWKFIDP